MKEKYFKNRKGEYYTKYTKEEIYAQINNDDPLTFIPFLKDMDYCYLEEEWQQMKGKTQNKVFGKYIALMRLCGYRSFTYIDSNRLNEIRRRKKNGFNN